VAAGQRAINTAPFSCHSSQKLTLTQALCTLKAVPVQFQFSSNFQGCQVKLRCDHVDPSHFVGIAIASGLWSWGDRSWAGWLEIASGDRCSNLTAAKWW
jgi:hypothetical protein